eukprot:1155807-Pelagomonas_calceolata.AAC.10
MSLTVSPTMGCPACNGSEEKKSLRLCQSTAGSGYVLHHTTALRVRNRFSHSYYAFCTRVAP